MAKTVSKKIKEQFANAETLGELKAIYLEATNKYMGTEAMTGVNALWNKYFDEVKTWNKARDGKMYEKPTTEEVGDFTNQIEVLKTLDVTLEMCGTWLWITGDTKPVKDTLKSVGCRFAPNKGAWYIAPSGAKRSRKHYTLEEIRAMHGSEEIEA